MREVIHTIETMKDTDTIANFIKRQDFDGCSTLINVLRYTSMETESLWLTVYNNLFKY